MSIKNGMWKERGGNLIPIARYQQTTKDFIPYCEEMHKFNFIWPFPEVITLESSSQVCVIAYPTSYTFRQREKVLKAQGWHNTGPMREKNCFVFAKKVDEQSPLVAGNLVMQNKQNSPIRIALNFDGRWFIWIDKGVNEGKTVDQFKMIVNMLETVL